jgi:hypothetical protein
VPLNLILYMSNPACCKNSIRLISCGVLLTSFMISLFWRELEADDRHIGWHLTVILATNIPFPSLPTIRCLIKDVRTQFVIRIGIYGVSVW